MKILLDEDVPRRLRRELPGHEVRTVRDMRWDGLTNGHLLRVAAADFAVFLTCDRNMKFLQNVAALSIAIIVLAAARNSITALRPLAPELRVLLEGDCGPVRSRLSAHGGRADTVGRVRAFIQCCATRRRCR